MAVAYVPMAARMSKKAAASALPPGPASMERVFGRRAHGTGSVVRNGAGYRWQLNRTGHYYKGPTVATRQQAIDDLDDALAALDRGEKPIEAKKQDTGRIRSKTIPPAALLRQIKQAENNEWKAVEYPKDVDRPITRGDCENAPRPCPFVSCSAHLYLDVNNVTGSVKLNFPHLEVWQMKESCSLDIADRGGSTLDEIGNAMGVTRERVRQIETTGIRKASREETLSLPPERETYAVATPPKGRCP